MKKLLLSILALGLLGTTQAQTLDRSVRPQPGPAPVINLGQPATFTLPNGLKVFVVENHKMPIVTYSIQLDIRPELEKDKAGMSDFVGQLITRGNKNYTKEEFDDAVDEIGANVAASGSSFYGVSLSKYQDQLLKLMSDALLHPNFQRDQLDKIVKQTKSGLMANENDADAMLQNVAGVVNFGTRHPYGEVVTPQTIQNVTLQDCQQYFDLYFRPNVAYMAVVGDITVDEAKTLVTKYFGGWEKALVHASEYPVATAPSQTVLDFVDRLGAVQSVIGITYPIDLPIGGKDVIKVQAMNQILGGGSSGKLFQNLRERHGWTYGSYSTFSPDDIVGTAQLYAKCRNLVTDSSIVEMFAEMDTMRNVKVSEETLRGVKNFLSGNFALGLESPQTIARYAINVERYKMPKDYYTNYLKNLDAVTTDDIEQMAQKYIRPDHAHVVVVGNRSELNKLKRFSKDGVVNYYDGFGNEVKPIEDKVIDGKTMQDVLDSYIAAIGGKEAIEGLTDLSVSANINLSGVSVAVAKLDQLVASPDKYLMDMRSTQTVGGQTVMVNGDKGYIALNGKKTEMSEDMVKSYQEDADLQAILHPEKYGTTYTLLEKSDVDGTPAFQVSKISNNGKNKAIQYYDAKTGLLIKETENNSQMGASRLEDKIYKDYKTVKGSNGYKMAFTVETTTPGQGTRVVKVVTAKANSGISDKKFK